MSAAGKRLTLALLLSLLIHAPLLSLTFGGERLGLPGFNFPWQKRRIEAPDLRVVLMPVRVIAAESVVPPFAEPLPQASVEPPVASGPTPAPSVVSASFDHPALILTRTLAAFEPKAEPEAKPTSPAKSESAIVTGAAPAASTSLTNAPAPTERSADTASPPITVPEVIATLRPEEATFVVPAPSPPAPVIAVAPSPETVIPAPKDAAEAAQKQAEPEVRERAVEVTKVDLQREAQRQRQADQLAASRAEASQREAERKETARLAEVILEVQRQEAARVKTARLEEQRQQTARLATAQVEAQRQEVARQAAVRIEAARLDTQRQESAQLESARLETARQAAVRQAAAAQEAARVLAEKEEDARREARRQAMGRKLNEEAAQREAATNAARSPSTLPYSLSTARRARLWGRTDANLELVQYAEAWARRIQFNTSVDTVRDVAKRPHSNPMVTVAIRSDGSVESVTIVVSSGVAEVDEAIRRIVQSQMPNPAFPPGLARAFDVIEVRRTWHFDTAVRLY